MSAHYWIRAYYTALTSDESADEVLRFCSRIGASGILLLTQSFDTEPGLLSRDEIHRRAAHLRKSVPRFRDAGLEVHINVMSTLGHGAPTLNTAEELAFDPMVDHLGNASPYTPCPLDTRFLEYVAELYGHMAETGASVLWADDDVRYTGHGTLGVGCFCPRHLDAIAARLGHPIERQELVGRMESGSMAEIAAWRETNFQALCEMAVVIQRAVHAVNPAIRVGLMTVSYAAHTAEGRNTPQLFAAFTPEGEHWFRPGSGFWNDERPLEVVHKTEDCLRQVALAGPSVRPVSEVENYPYSRAAKSLQMLHLELTLNALAGIADQSLNLFHAVGGVAGTDIAGTGADYEGFLASEKRWLDAIADVRNRMKRQGVGVAADERTGLFLRGDLARWPRQPSWSLLFARLGLPLGTPGCPPHLVADAMADVLTPDELEAMAHEGIIVDGPAAERLVGRKLGALIGLKSIHRIEPCGYERLTDDPFNGSAAHRLLSWRHGVPEAGIYGCEPATSAGRVLSRMLSMAGTDLGAGIVLTPLPDQSRAAVLPWGAPPLWNFADQVRQIQMHAVCAWALGRPLSASVAALPNLYPIVWANSNDTQRLIAVANLSFDEAADVPLRLDTTPWAVDRLAPSGKWEMCDPVTQGTPLYLDVGAWSVAVRLLRRTWSEQA